jgi:hypothetical protein
MTKASTILEESVRRDRNRDLPWLRLYEMRQRVKAAKDDDAQHNNNGQKPQQARHQALALIPLVPANGSEYDHVRPGRASYSEGDPDIPALGQKGVRPRFATLTIYD